MNVHRLSPYSHLGYANRSPHRRHGRTLTVRASQTYLLHPRLNALFTGQSGWDPMPCPRTSFAMGSYGKILGTQLDSARVFTTAHLVWREILTQEPHIGLQMNLMLLLSGEKASAKMAPLKPRLETAINRGFADHFAERFHFSDDKEVIRGAVATTVTRHRLAASAVARVTRAAELLCFDIVREHSELEVQTLVDAATAFRRFIDDEFTRLM